MKVAFYVVGVLALFSSLVSCAIGKSAMQEIVGATVGVIAILAFGIGAVLDKLDAIDKMIREQSYEFGKALKEFWHPK